MEVTGNKKSEAVRLAEKDMSIYYPEWHKKFPDYKRNTSYLKCDDGFRWNENFLKDPDNYRNMSPEKILEDLFNDFNNNDPKVIFNGKK